MGRRSLFLLLSTPSIAVGQCLKLVDAASKVATCPPQIATPASAEIPGKDFADTAISVVNTVEVTAAFVVGVMVLILGVAAYWGWREIVSAAKKHAERIAVLRWKEYTEAPEFIGLIKASVDESVERRWQDIVVAPKLVEETRSADDPPAFEEKA